MQSVKLLFLYWHDLADDCVCALHCLYYFTFASNNLFSSALAFQHNRRFKVKILFMFQRWRKKICRVTTAVTITSHWVNKFTMFVTQYKREKKIECFTMQNWNFIIEYSEIIVKYQHLKWKTIKRCARIKGCYTIFMVKCINGFLSSAKKKYLNITLDSRIGIVSLSRCSGYSC